MKALNTLVAVAAVAIGGLVATGTAHAQTNFGQTSKATNVKKAAVLADQGNALKAKGDHDAALNKFVAAIELDATNTTALMGAAWICNEKEKYEDAKVFAAAAFLADTTNQNALREVGYAEWKLGNLKEAKTYLFKCNDRDLAAYTYLIAVLDDLGETDTAEQVRRLKAKVEQETKTDLFDLTKGK